MGRGRKEKGNESINCNMHILGRPFMCTSFQKNNSVKRNLCYSAIIPVFPLGPVCLNVVM